MFMILTILFSAIIKRIRDILNSVRPKTVIFPPTISGMSPMSGIYASLQQAQIITRLRRVNPRNPQYIDACPAVFKREGGYNFYLPPYKRASPGQTATKDRKAEQVVFLDASVPDSFIEGNGAGS